MRGTFFFVHGTGVRQERYDALWATIRDRAGASGMTGVDFVGCAWGPTVGVSVSAARIADTLPPDAATRAAVDGAPTEDELAVALWALLLDDPLFELRLASGGEPRQSIVAVAAARPDQAAVSALQSLRAAPPDVGGTGLDAAELAAAAERIAATEELRAAATAAGSAADAGLVEAMARAVVASALGARRTTGGVPPAAALSRATRDELVDRVAAALAPAGTRGVGKWIKDRTTAFAARRATAFARERRDKLTIAGLPGIGDILYYERRGDAIAGLVAGALDGLQRPVVAVGHSLGGIILVDLLTRAAPPHADVLVTVGSQAPLLYAIDALGTLRPGGAQAPFVPWLNIYDRSDLLSYCAARVFSGAGRVCDEEVVSGVPFPESHSAYWQDDRVYELIRGWWPG
jgi:hypothetical protein